MKSPIRGGVIPEESTLDSPPVHEGMAIAESKLFLSTQDGRLYHFVPQAEDDPHR